VTSGSKVNTPEPRSTSQPAKVSSSKPKPCPLPHKPHQPSPPGIEDDSDLQIIDKSKDAGDKPNDSAYFPCSFYLSYINFMSAIHTEPPGSGADGPIGEFLVHVCIIHFILVSI
jgi:hypothetical protein